MNGICIREDELLTALSRGLVGAELSEHAAACDACSELLALAGALLDDRAAAIAEAPVPAAGTMWWRMRVRQRQEAVATARRSLFIGQAATLAVALALIAAFFGDEIVFGLREMVATVKLSTPVVLAVATWLLVAPIAGWAAIRQK
jgi:hypothetical protein